MVGNLVNRNRVDIHIADTPFAKVFFVNHCRMLSLSRRFPLVSPNNTIEIRVGPFKTDSEATDSGEQLYDITMFHSLLKNVCKFREKIPSIQILADNRGLEFLLNCGNNLRFPLHSTPHKFTQVRVRNLPKNGVQNGVRLKGAARRRRQAPWRASARLPKGSRSSEATGRSGSEGRMPLTGAVSAADWG